MLVFKGIQKTTLIDFPGKVSSTLFLPKCNFRCPFCYNKQLVLDQDTGVRIPEDDALVFLKERKSFLDGVCITGGEPLLYPKIVSFCEKVKQLGLEVKVDTNGSFPKILKELLEKKLVDFVAMDIKSSPREYEKAVGAKVDLDAINESVSLLKKGNADYEFRMTAVPGFHSEKTVKEIGCWLEGSKAFYLQQFNSLVPLLDEGLQEKKPFDSKKLGEFASILRPFFEKVEIRGL